MNKSMTNDILTGMMSKAAKKEVTNVSNHCNTKTKIINQVRWSKSDFTLILKLMNLSRCAIFEE